MEAYEMRNHIGNITELLSEILAEVKGLREDYKEHQALEVCMAELPPIEIGFDAAVKDFLKESHD